MTSLSSRLKTFSTAIDQDDYETVVKLAADLLKEKEEVLPDAVQRSIQSCRVHALLALEQFALAALSATNKDDDNMIPLKLYAMYRQEKYTDVLKELASCSDDNDSLFLQLLHAQTLFHMGDSHQAAALYRQVLLREQKKKQDIDDSQQFQTDLQTNLLACLVAHAVPYCGAQDEKEEDDEEFSLINQDLADKDYDLAFNLASYKLLSHNHEHWRRVLAHASVQVEDQDDNDDGESARKLNQEVAPLAYNLVWSRAFWNGSFPQEEEEDADKKGGDDSMPLRVTSMQHFHRALAASNVAQLEAIDRTKWNLLQNRIYHYNRAVLHYRLGQPKQVLQACQDLKETLKHCKRSHPDAVLWWQTRISVLEHLVDAKKYTLDGMLTKLQQQSPSSVRDHALLYLQLHMPDFSMDDIPESLQSKPAIQATRAANTAVNKKESLQGVALADLYYSQGKYQEAARLYEDQLAQKKNDDDHGTLHAKWVRALSHLDPARAVAEWAKQQEAAASLLDEDGDEDDGMNANGAALEQRPLPKLSRKTSVVMQAAEDGKPSSSSKKSHDAVLRRRARQRDAYLAKLEAAGNYTKDRPSKPDPERWLPKYERSGARRRRNQQQHKGAQGGVSAADAMKLDVVARKEAREENPGRSTAHMTVTSSSSRKTGKRK